MATSFEECLVSLSGVNDWYGVIEAGKEFSFEEKSKFLWAWPSVQCFEWLKRILNATNIERILSIGCGSGLLKWLISKATGTHAVGLELDKSWWKSPYSPRAFIELKFTESQITNQFLKDCIQTDENKFALLFCYFNNRMAFLEYVRAYGGDLIIIVGPTSEHHIVTDPNPLNPNFENDEWTLLDCCRFNDQHSNCMSIFQRIKPKEAIET